MKHPTKVVGYEGSLFELAYDIGKMNYYQLANFLDYLGNDLKRQSDADKKRGRTQLSGKLELAVKKIYQARDKMISIAKLCEPYMEEE